MGLGSYLPDRKTWLFVLGIAFLSYGSAAFQYSRWDHRSNANVHPVFHAWAVIVGIFLVWYSLPKRPNRR